MDTATTLTEPSLTAVSTASGTIAKAGNDIVSVSPSSSSINDETCDVDIATATTLNDFNVNAKKTTVSVATMNVVLEEEYATATAAPVTTTTTKSTSTSTTNTIMKDHISSSCSQTVIKENETITTTTYNDEDILCGRGKGIRQHPGNQLYNRLLREHYEEYANAPKGSKLSIVKIVVTTIRNQQLFGGRFLEQQDDNDDYDNDKTNAPIVYADIGDVRALNKTAQAFRDMRVAEEKRQHQQKERRLYNIKQEQPQPTTSISNKKLKIVGGVAGGGMSRKSTLKTTTLTMRRLSPPLPIMGQRLQQQPRRPTFQERLKSFHRQQRRDERRRKRKDCAKGYEDDGSNYDSSCSSSSSTENDDNSDNDSISDTETEDSFPFYNRSRNPTQKSTNY